VKSEFLIENIGVVFYFSQKDVLCERESKRDVKILVIASM